jgi:hypothetical protein
VAKRSTAWSAPRSGCRRDRSRTPRSPAPPPYLRLFATAAGGTLLTEEALAATRLPSDAGADPAARIAIARFFAEHIAVQARGLERSVSEGADGVLGADAALAG